MSKCNKQTVKAKMKAIAGAMKDRGAVMAGVVGTAVSPGFAFAADFDSSEVLAAIAGMVAGGILIYTAYAVGKWTMKAFGLIGGK